MRFVGKGRDLSPAKRASGPLVGESDADLSGVRLNPVELQDQSPYGIKNPGALGIKIISKGDQGGGEMITKPGLVDLSSS